MFRITLEQVNPINGQGMVVSILDIDDEMSSLTTLNMTCIVEHLRVGPQESFKFPRDSAKAWRFIARFLNDVFKDKP